VAVQQRKNRFLFRDPLLQVIESKNLEYKEPTGANKAA
jgi:hypothetical protein